jgi:hypothetical protein
MTIAGAGREAASEVNERAGVIRHLGTHRKLVSQTERLVPETTLVLDAIVVPASRPAQNLEHAITLARALDCRLLILCSHRVKTADVHKLLAKRSFSDAIVVELPDDYRHELLDFPALAKIKEDLPAACSWYVTDLSVKRNVGLLLARMMGWRRIFFLDDDIRDINPVDVQSTVSMLGSYPAAGMRVSEFPDNSAVCHAHRAIGGLQDVFITGAALAVDCQRNTGFFPDIYNEDWLFFFDNASRGLLGSSPREVTQLRYNPFAEPERAGWQEFGDVLAEGLYTLLDLGLGLQNAIDGYWAYFLEARRTFLEAILGRADKMNLSNKEQLQLSVEMALKCSVKIGPNLLERYTLLWQRDLRDWQRRIAGVRDMPSLGAALETLGLERSADDGIADVTTATDAEGPTTMPFALQELYDLLQAGAQDDGHVTSGGGRRGGPNRRARMLPHHGSPGIQEIGRLASTLRGFWPGRGHGSSESNPALEIQTPTEKVYSLEPPG